MYNVHRIQQVSRLALHGMAFAERQIDTNLQKKKTEWNWERASERVCVLAGSLVSHAHKDLHNAL